MADAGMKGLPWVSHERVWRGSVAAMVPGRGDQIAVLGSSRGEVVACASDGEAPRWVAYAGREGAPIVALATSLDGALVTAWNDEGKGIIGSAGEARALRELFSHAPVVQCAVQGPDVSETSASRPSGVRRTICSRCRSPRLAERSDAR